MPAHEPGIDTSKPNIARVWDYWLGGKDNFAADREMAQQVEALFGPPQPGHLPVPREMAVRNRQFLERAVTWCARQRGIAQYLDLGSGLPAGGAVPMPDGTVTQVTDTHTAARAVIGDARVVYADIDRVAVSHAQALLSGTGVTAVPGDIRDPGAILADPAVGAVIGLEEPCCVVLGMVLHFCGASEARRITGDITARLAPGSVLVVSVARCDDPELWEAIQGVYTAGSVWNHSAGEVETWFSGLDVLKPGVVPARGWRPGWRESAPSDAPSYALCGVAVKPY
ncbi:MAG TPA: SAM-dependent methyltransferase [Streptosporangiaceae bacterium]|nr:SAM-dependent methyltransferase [Streptosporangiaceae bacterium]